VTARRCCRLRLIVVAALVAACGGGSAGPDLDSALGGGTTTAALSRNAFGLPAPGLTNAQRREFEVGNSFFTKNWVTAPSSTEARDGLGPTFNAQACSSCHTLDGRGAPPAGPEDAAALGLLVRLSVPAPTEDAGEPRPGVPGETAVGAVGPEPTYGGQLQDRAVLGVPSEGRLVVRWVTEAGRYADGTRYELRRPDITIADLAFGPLADGTLVSARLAPQVIGVGLLEQIPGRDLEAAADPEDDDGDGISGRVNRVPDPRSGATTVGRFGWKANVASVEAQTAGAFHGDIGITSSLAPEDNCGPRQTACAAAPTGGSPEIDDERLGHVVFYNRTLAVPAMRGHARSDVRAGAARFTKLGCGACHTRTQRSGSASIAVLAHQSFHPYTDLLLHDMGDGLADGRPDFLASGREWRTPPLWGLGLLDDVNGYRFLLHDGRARTIEEAILWHGGEAATSMRAFRALPADERAELVAFLEAL
jgi:CxxC motif-containing protein (DUF1111 family)